jgi:molybdopterin converting factor small subunit
MAHLRLFASLREAAGTGSATVDGATVGEVLDEARARFGPEFAALAAQSRVWLNGDDAPLDATVGEDDEVAVLPPVSGGV